MAFDDVVPGQPENEDQQQVSRLALLLSGYGRNARVGSKIDPSATPYTPAPSGTPGVRAPGYGPSGMADSIARPTGAPAAAAPDPMTMAPPAAMPPGVAAAPTPVYRRQADESRLQGMQDQLRQDRQPIDPKTVAPHLWERILGGVVGFGRGYGHDPNAIAEGAAVTNRRYNTAEAQREGKVAGEAADMEDFVRGMGTRRQDEQDALNADMARSRSDREGVESQARIRNIDSEIQARADKPAPADKSPAAQATSRQQALAELKKAGYKFTPDEEKEYLVNGKLDERQPRENRAPTDLEMWMQAFQRDNKRMPTADEIANRKATAGGKGGSNKPNAALNTEINKATDKKKSDWQEEQTRHDRALKQLTKLQPDPQKRAQQESEMTGDHLRRLQEIQNDWEGALGRSSVGVDHYDVESGKKDSQQGGAPAPAAAAPKQQQPQNQPMNRVDEFKLTKPPKPGTQLSDKNVVQQYIKAAGGDKAKARQLAQKDGWKF